MKVNLTAFTPSGARPKVDGKPRKAAIQKAKDAVIESFRIPNAGKQETVVHCGKSKKGLNTHLNDCSEAGLAERLGYLSEAFSSLLVQPSTDGVDKNAKYLISISTRELAAVNREALLRKETESSTGFIRNGRVNPPQTHS